MPSLLISEGQLRTALAEQKKSGRKLGRVLIDNGYVDLATHPVKVADGKILIEIG